MPKTKAKINSASTHNLADYVIYTISVPHIANRVLAKSVSDVLVARRVPDSYQRISPGADIRGEDGTTVAGQQSSSLQVPRLCTFWRGQEQEDAWTSGIREALGKLDVGCVITCEPWAPLPGYPRGAIGD